MTVITHALSEKKLQKEPLVQPDAAPRPEHDAESGGRAQSLVRVKRDRRQPVRQRTPVTSPCFFLTAILLFCAGMASCVYLYQQYQDYQVLCCVTPHITLLIYPVHDLHSNLHQVHRIHFRGWCGIPIASELSDNAASESVDLAQMQALLDQTAESLSRGLPKGGVPPNYFDEEFDLDLEFEKYEKIETPDFSNGRKGRFVHDFAKVCF